MRSSGTYEIRTYGCQMNMHDSERLAGLLEKAGYRRAAAGATPDVVVFNTCAVRENADNRLYGNLGQLLPVKNGHPGMQIAVGGCLAQKDQERDHRPGALGRRGVRHPQHRLAAGAAGAGPGAAAGAGGNRGVAGALPLDAAGPPRVRLLGLGGDLGGLQQHLHVLHRAGLRGREEDRRPGDMLAEIRALVADGALEVTLLGQNVNSYGAEFGDRLAFAKLLRACGEIDGLERVRFTSPHPRDFTDDVIDAMAQTPNVMPQLHMPLQSGSDAVLRAMRRAYRRDKYLGDPREGPRRDAGRRDHHRHHRRASPGRPNATSRHAGRRARGPVRRRVHVPVLDPARGLPPPPWTARCQRRWCRSGTSG